MTTYANANAFNFLAAPIIAFSSSGYSTDPTPLNTVLRWIPSVADVTIELDNFVTTDTGNSEMLATGITPGWWSEELTAEDIEISMMSREAILAEIMEMGGSWADRPEAVEAVENARKAWGKKISELYADQDHSA